MGISSCLIAKNEKDNIRRCLESIKEFSDEIIIVDTGSTDNTIEIAKEYGCKIYYHPWNNDFSEARNMSLRKATQDWIFVIDCDEEVETESVNLIKELSKTKENIEGFGVLISNLINGIESYASLHLRFFRNRDVYEYEGIIHEQLGDSLKRYDPNSYILKSDIKLKHYGYEIDPELEARKSKRNLEILNMVEEEKRDGMYYFHLGAEYTRLEDYQKAADTFVRGYTIGDKTQPYFPQLAHKTVDALYTNKEYDKCIFYCNDILTIFNDFRCIYFIMGACYLDLKKYYQALDSFVNYMNIEDKPSKYPVINYEANNDIIGLITKLKNDLGVI